jgi:hypothetical protein
MTVIAIVTDNAAAIVKGVELLQVFFAFSFWFFFCFAEILASAGMAPLASPHSMCCTHNAG